MQKAIAAALALLAWVGSVPAQQAPATSGPDAAMFRLLRWRSIGPFRGGRSVAVAGSAARPAEYYFGATGGGLWKTTDGGVNWTCVSDGFFRTSSVGAIAVSPSNPDVVYAGMGERSIRGNISYGDGVYKSTDGGRTWSHIGLKDSQTVSRIRVHPTNPDIVYAAVLGHVFGPNEERGLYKSTDGGTSWRRILYESSRAGVVDLSMDAKDPEVLYASTWEAWRTPYALNSGGPGSKLWRTSDGGRTWTDLSRKPGLPKGVLGKIGVSVSPADSNRVYALIEALDGGLFVSNDAGATWSLANDSRGFRQRAWYYTYVHAGPKDRDQVYVLNVGMARSGDGGKTFSGVGTPHSDNHDLWIAPDNPDRMINSNDGGANVSTDGGRTWTDQDFPTAQFYHVTTDNAFPYRVYGAQQDNSTVRIASRTQGGGITSRDWEGTAGGESGYIAVHPDDPDLVFGGSYGGYLEMLNHRTRQSRNVNPWPDNPMGHGAGALTHRFQWTFPIVFSPHRPNVLYATSQHLHKSDNRGETWKIVSPDLTRHDPRTLGPSGGPITKDNTSVEYYGTIFAIAESPLRPGVIWCGSDDGLVHISRDGGASWQNVTPRTMPGRDLQWPMVSIIEPSPHEPGGAYLAVTNYKNDDHRPYVFRTTDYGRTWSLVVGGIPDGAYVRAVRADPVKSGLLYAGTETGLYVSFDDGERWQPLQMNLPVTPIHDLVVKDDDVVVATHGRSFWILDDITPLRQAELAPPASPYLFQPKDAIRVNWGGGFGGGRRGGTAEPVGQNPASGATITYHLPEAVPRVRFTFLDSEGNVVASRDAAGERGTHRFATGLQYPGFRGFPGMILWAAGSRPIPAPPGVYRVRMEAGSDVHTREFRLRGDPRSEASEADLRAQYEFARRISDRVNDANDAVVRIRAYKAQIDERRKERPALARQGEALAAKLSAIEEELYQVRNRSGQDPLNYPIKLNNRIAALLGVVLSGDYRPTDQTYQVFAELSRLLQIQLDALAAVEDRELRSFNDALRRAGSAPIAPPAARAAPPGRAAAP